MTEASKSKNKIAPKKEGNLNALVHGLYASEIVLPWESAEEFEQLHNDLQNEWRPDGRMELETVFGLARLFWIKRRLVRTWELGFRKDPLVQDMVNSGRKSWAEFRNYLRDQAKDGFSAVDAAKDLYSQMQATLQLLSEELGKRTEKSPDWGQIYNLHQQWQRHMGAIQKFFLLPAKTEHPPNQTQILDQPYEPEVLDRIVKLEAALDARIDKTVARLVNLKEYKRIAGLKPVSLRVPQHTNVPPPALQQKVVEGKNASS
jgi:hypothetical protein